MAKQGLNPSPAVADRQLGWVDHLPERLRPFAILARWDRPIGTWLLLLPCWWGAALAPGWPNPVLLALFALGAIAMRGAGCTINDLIDRDLDARVERTRNRPLASGQIGIFGALAFLALQLLVGLFVLLSLNPFTIALALASVPLIVIYPLMKRVTWWPQLVLGITFNWGALVGWSAATGGLGPAPLALYAAGIFWTLGYDTVYAHQDKADDALVGVRSSALRLGSATPRWVAGFYAATVLLLALAGWLAGMSLLYFLVLPAVALHFLWQVRTLELDDPVSCLARFRSNRDLGLLVVAAILLGHLAP